MDEETVMKYYKNESKFKPIPKFNMELFKQQAMLNAYVNKKDVFKILKKYESDLVMYKVIVKEINKL